MYKIKHSEQFLIELKGVYDYICNYLNSPIAAKSLLNEVDNYISSLELFPEGYSKLFIPRQFENRQY